MTQHDDPLARTPAQKALLQYRQADEEGVMVLVSRQAIHDVMQELCDLSAKLDAERSRANMRHETIAKAVFDTVQDHAATWDTASDELVWYDPSVDCANEKHWKVSDAWLNTCCTRFPQWADDLRAFAKNWNEDEPVTDEMLAEVEVDEKDTEQHTRRAMQIMRYYDKLRRTEQRATLAESRLATVFERTRERCAKEATCFRFGVDAAEAIRSLQPEGEESAAQAQDQMPVGISPEPASAAALIPGLERADLDVVRQWFDNVQDVNPAYLEAADYLLAKRIYELLGMRVPNSIRSKIELNRK